MPTRRSLLLSAGLLIVSPMLAKAQGPAFPNRTIRILNPFAAGGTSDILARIVATGMQEVFKHPVIVESRPGAGGMVALEQIAQSSPDGYNLAMSPAAMSVARYLMKGLSFDPTRDLVPVALVGKAPSLLVVSAQSRLKSVAEVVQFAKANPGRLNYASFGVGTTPHLFMELFNIRLGLKTTHVPYKGAGPAVADLLGGQVDLAFQTAAAVLPHVQQGRLIALATSSKERLPGLPAVPTIAESGIPSFDESAWFGLVAARATPAAIVQRLNMETNRILQTAQVRKQLDDLGVIPAALSADGFSAFVKAEEEKWSDLVEKLGIKSE